MFMCIENMMYKLISLFQDFFSRFIVCIFRRVKNVAHAVGAAEYWEAFVHCETCTLHNLLLRR